MARWKVEAYELHTDGTKHGGEITDKLLSGKLQLQLNDTNKFTFSTPRVSFPVDLNIMAFPNSGKYINYNTLYVGSDWKTHFIDNAASQYFSFSFDLSNYVGKKFKVTLTSATANSPRAFGFCNSSDIISSIWQEKTAYTYNSASGLYEWESTITDTNFFFSVRSGEDPQFYVLGATDETPDFSPLKTAVVVSRVGSTTQKMFTGIVTNRVYDVTEGVYKYQCVGALGAYKFMPPYRLFTSGSDLDFVLQTTCDRFRGTATGGYAIFNPTTELYSKFPEIFTHFGDMSIGFAGLEMNDSLANIQQSSSDAEAFIKAVIDPSCYKMPSNFEAPVICENVNGQINFYSGISGVNTQEIRYDKNLLDCTIEDIPFVTYAEATYNGAGAGKAGADYPDIFYYKGVELPQTDTPYTFPEMEAYDDTLLAEPRQMITATAFDAGILDDGTPFLDITRYADIVYLENGGERRVQAQITSITYDLTNPSRDRVQLGKKIIPLTQRS